MDFMKNVEKSLSKSGIDVGKASPPEYWYSSGNYALNKVMTGSFMRGVPQGRIVAFCGPSQSGKSFNLTNLMREAQKEGAYVVAIDSENALDDNFVSKLGVNTEENYSYITAVTISDCTKAVSEIVSGWKKEYAGLDDAPKLLIAIDSISMLNTITELENFEKSGVIKGDQGQRSKQVKAMLASFTSSIKGTNITIALTSQVYANQDIMNGKGPWIVNDALQYSASQIILITRLNLKDKDKDSRAITGIRMKCYGFKNRFSKPFESVTIEVPYEAGMDSYNGLLPIAEQMGVVTKAGAWYTFPKTGEKFQSKNFNTVQEKVLEECESIASAHHLEAILQDGEFEARDGGQTMKEKREALLKDHTS